MTDFNPLAGAILGSSQVQHQAGVQKQRQLRRAQTLRKDSAAGAEDHFEHSVESSDAVGPAHDRPQQDPRQSKNEGHAQDHAEDEDRPRLDLIA